MKIYIQEQNAPQIAFIHGTENMGKIASPIVLRLLARMFLITSFINICIATNTGLVELSSGSHNPLLYEAPLVYKRYLL